MPPSPSRSCRRAWGALLASALATAACRPDLALPSEAELSCRAGDRCPDGYVCNELVGRCVSTAGGDRRPPEVVAGSARVEPALAGRGRTVVVRFAVDEPLALPPQLRLATAAAPAWTSAEEREGTWASSYAPTGDEPEGSPLTVTALLVDRAGNTGQDVALGTVTFDFTPPRVVHIEPVGQGHATRGGRAAVDVVVVVDEAPPAPPRAWLAETGLPLSLDAASQPPFYRFVHEVGSGDEEGRYGVRVVVADAAGNRTEASAADVVVLDFEPPRLLASPSVLDPVVRPGTAVAVQLEVDEPLARDPAVELRAGEETLLGLDRGERDGGRYLFTREVPAAPDGAYDVVVSGLVDLAGNQGEAWTGVGLVRIDGTPPTLVGEPELDRSPPTYRAGDAVRVTPAVSEDLRRHAPRVRLDIDDPRPLACAPAEERTWTCTLGQPLRGDEQPAGLVPVSIDLEDDAGNTTSTDTLVTLDFEGPGLALDPVLSRCDGLGRVPDAAEELWVRLGRRRGSGEPPRAAPRLLLRRGAARARRPAGAARRRRLPCRRPSGGR